MIITHDLHIHTHLSRCAKPAATPGIYIENARSLGLQTIGIADHMWDAAIPLNDNQWKNFYKFQNYEHILLAKEEFSKVDSSGICILFGAEGEYDPVHHGIGVTEEVCEKLDFLLIPNSHTHMMMPKDLYEPKKQHADFMLKAFWYIITCPESKYITAIAHPFGAVACKLYPAADLYLLISYQAYCEAFHALKEKGITYEINTSGMHNLTDDEIKASPNMDIIRLAHECGTNSHLAPIVTRPKARSVFIRLRW